MKTYLLLLLVPIAIFSMEAQELYKVSSEQPFGKLNPEAPKEIGDYASLIGICD